MALYASATAMIREIDGISSREARPGIRGRRRVRDDGARSPRSDHSHDLGENALADFGVRLHDPAFFKSERTLLLKKAGRKPDLANVMHQPCKVRLLLCQPPRGPSAQLCPVSRSRLLRSDQRCTGLLRQESQRGPRRTRGLPVPSASFALESPLRGDVALDTSRRAVCAARAGVRNSGRSTAKRPGMRSRGPPRPACKAELDATTTGRASARSRGPFQSRGGRASSMRRLCQSALRGESASTSSAAMTVSTLPHRASDAAKPAASAVPAPVSASLDVKTAHFM